MYNGIQKIEEVIDIIEKNITEQISCEFLASKMNLSVYEFRRIFAFIVGCPISDYIRRRRLSLAACEILSNEDVSLRILSEKYGYSSQSAFIKAFKEQHGVSPSAYLKGKNEITLFTLPKFQMSVSGRENIPFKIIKEDKFYISGFTGISTFTDTCCCENIWNEFYNKDFDKKLKEAINTNRLYVSYENSDSNVFCNIGVRDSVALKGFDLKEIPASTYACFELKTTEDNAVNQKYSQILYELLPSANLKRNYKLPIIEVYPFDMSKEGFNWEIRIPIK